MNGSKVLETHLFDRGSSMATRGTIFYAFTKSRKALGIQLRDPSELAIIAIATKLSRMVESPEREDSYLDLIGYAAILGRCRFSTPEDWDDIEFDSQS
jgi:hypothetical protein